MSSLFLKVFVAVIALGLGILSQFEIEEEILIAEKTVVLPTSRAKVFQYLADMRNYGKWYPQITECMAVDMAPMSVGKHFQITFYITLFGEVTYNMMIAGYESPRFISFVLDDWIGSRVDMVLDRRNDGHYPTSMTWSLYSRNRSFLMKYFATPFISLMYTAEARSALIGLRSTLMH